MLIFLHKIICCGYSLESSIHNICFYGEMTKIILQVMTKIIHQVMTKIILQVMTKIILQVMTKIIHQVNYPSSCDKNYPSSYDKNYPSSYHQIPTLSVPLDKKWAKYRQKGTFKHVLMEYPQILSHTVNPLYNDSVCPLII